MANDISLGEALAVAAGGVSICAAIGAGIWAFRAYRTGRLRSGWLRLRVQALGGVTTLEQTLSYNCAICGYSLDGREEVRKLSCGHVCHHVESDKCEGDIDKLLCELSMACPLCNKTALPVWPWEARPPLSAPPAPAPASPWSASASSAGSSESVLPLSTPVFGEDEEEPLLQ
ncbi:hypothetical protein QOZ80_4AG0311420 [Eleusine coracana subsp. coracana]|nr:hypothetical protein QOZ80_4AG0311420 [Eleusine coracana subsp. coracana]